MSSRLKLNRETLRRLDARDLGLLPAAGAPATARTQACAPNTQATFCDNGTCGTQPSVTLCDQGTCGTETIKTSITRPTTGAM